MNIVTTRKSSKTKTIHYRKAIILILVSLTLQLSNSSSASEESKTETVVAANTAFAFDLYQQLAQEKEGNLFFSPYSISTALAMTYAGARGKTEDQMARTLHLAELRETVHTEFKSLEASLHKAQKTRHIELHTANALWPHQDYPFQSAYLKLVKDCYRISLTNLDYKNHPEKARLIINRWIEKKTKKKIRDLFAPGTLARETRLVLTNAIYFKGKWDRQFKKNSTKLMPFHTTADQQLDTPMMHQEGKLGYTEDERLQILELPYRSKRLSMLILLPREIDGLADLERTINPLELDNWIQQMHLRSVQAWLPKFKLTSSFDLNKTLESLGITDAFHSMKANFSGMDGSHDLFISKVTHKAFVEVNEEGTEAAAATGVGMVFASAPISLPPVFRADHPFLFLIYDRQTRTILFMGRLTEPIYKQTL